MSRKSGSTELRLVDVGHTYSSGDLRTRVLDDVNLTIRPGSMTALLGPSGSGKSTLLSIMGLLLQPSRGGVLVNGADVTDATPDDRAALRNSALGFVFQAFHLIDHKTVRENVALHDRYAPTPIGFDPDVVLEQVGLGHRLDAFPPTLSGGERQRCAVARALFSRAPFILCDEPTGNLDTENTESVMTLLAEVAGRGDRAVVVITHDHDVAARADQRYRVEVGRVRPT